MPPFQWTSCQLLLRRLLRFLRFVAQRFDEDALPQVAASLTYTTLLALVPLITIALSVIAAFPFFSHLTDAFQSFVFNNLVPAQASKLITVYLGQFSEKAAQLTALGLTFLALTALMLMHTIETAFNQIWRVRRMRPFGQRFLIYWAVLTLGPVLIGASLSLTSYAINLPLKYVRLPWFSAFMFHAMPIALTVLALILLYATVANRYVPIQHAIIGGIVAGSVFELMKFGFELYISYFPTYALIYGTFASIPIFLIWVYLSWLIILAGAALTAALSQWQGDVWEVKRTPGRRFYDALAILHRLYLAQKTGQVVTLVELRQEIHASLEELDDLIDQLQSLQLVRPSAPGFVLSRDPDTVSVGDVFQLLVLSPLGDADVIRQANAWLCDFAKQLEAELQTILAMPLSRLFTQRSLTLLKGGK